MKVWGLGWEEKEEKENGSGLYDMNREGREDGGYRVEIRNL